MKKPKRRSFEIPLSEVTHALQTIQKVLPPSPLLFNSWMSEYYDCEIYLKLENMQPIGSFKIRGATYKIAQLSAEEKKRGVIAASAGNHAQGVAWGSRQLGVSALIVMPKTAPLVKIKNTETLGAKVVLEGENYDEAYEAALKLAKKTRRVFVHAFDDPEVIAGQGTVALELIQQLPDFDYVIGAVGGGGLMAGVSSVLKHLKPSVKVIGAQATGCSAMMDSLKMGRPITLNQVDTFADGIAVGKTKELPFQILKKNIDGMFAADDESIAAAILTLAEKAKVVSEGAGAVGVAILDQIRKKIKGKKVVILVCGGNIDVNVLNRVIDRGLIRKGRRLRVNVLISDRTGSLARLTASIAEAGANVLQAIHDRSEPSTTLDRTEVLLTLETRGHEHSKDVLEMLKKKVLQMTVLS
jgi:threonine dehydratase